MGLQHYNIITRIKFQAKSPNLSITLQAQRFLAENDWRLYFEAGGLGIPVTAAGR